MEDEMTSHMENQTWKLVPVSDVPQGKKVLQGRWVFTVKRDEHGHIQRYKSRFCAKGYMQREGVDFNEVYAPTSKHVTLRALLAVAAEQDLEVHQMDIKTAFLHGELEEEIYIEQPKGFELPGMVCRLQKSIYGLRQAPRVWYTKLKGVLEEINFQASDADPGLFTRHDKSSTAHVLVHVDDLLLVGKPDIISSTKRLLGEKFDTKDMGPAKYYIGMEIERNHDEKTLVLSQKRYATDIVERFGMADAKTVNLPSLPTTKIKAEESKLLDDKGRATYMEMVGSLLYLAVCTRPDINQAVGALARYMSKPTAAHLEAAKRVLRYVAGTSQMGIVFGGTKTATLHGYCDSDFAGDPDTRRSTTGYLFLLNGGAISWSSRLQPTVAASTCEAEFMAAAAAVKEALWLRKLMPTLGTQVHTLRMFCDNQGTIKMLKNPIESARSKHIDIAHKFARERTCRGEISFQYVRTDQMTADVLTKPLPLTSFMSCRDRMGVA
jgi:hypothetical protein